MTSVGFRTRGPLNIGARGGWPTFHAIVVALHDLELVLAAATVDRAAHVMPNRFRCIGEVTGFDFGGGASSGNSWRGRGLRKQALVHSGRGRGESQRRLRLVAVLGGRVGAEA
jgi:hypothetical protein